MITIKKSIITEIINQCENEIKKARAQKIEKIEDVKNIEIYKNKGIIYFLVSNNENQKILYIGKSKGKYFRQRVRAHFFGKGKGTQSKNCFVTEYKKIKGQDILLKYIVIENNPLRNFIEEILINKYNKKNELWNNKSCPK